VSDTVIPEMMADLQRPATSIGPGNPLTAYAGIGAGNDNVMPVWFGGIFGAGAIIILPILYGCFGALGGALTAVMYNVVAGMVGGLLVETE